MTRAEARPDGARQHRSTVETVVVAGATGGLGSRIAAKLAVRGIAVRALVRPATTGPTVDRLESAGIEVRRADLEDPTTLPDALAGASCVVSTATSFPGDRRDDAIARVDEAGTIALVDAADASGAVTRFVFVSFKPVPDDFPLQRAKRAVERRLAAAALDAVVLRPGKFMDIWFSPLCGFDVAAAKATIFGTGDRPVTWIAAQDVAEIAARAALGEGPARGTFELGGPQALSQLEVVERFEATTGRRFTLDALPQHQLESRLAGASHPVDRSLFALMLEAARGAITPVGTTLEAFPVELTTVSEFAAA
jgi:uncharacterized protein YbjT (DUF2867 family)